MNKTSKIEKKYCFPIKKVLAALIVLFLSVGFQFAGQRILSIQGKEGYPFFDLQGNFNIVYVNPYGGISIATVQEEEDAIDRISLQDINYANNINFIRAKKDNTGKTWLIWEERDPGKSDIYISQLKNKRIFNKKNLTSDQRGFNHSPDMDISIENDVWVTWVNYFQKKYTVLVKNANTDQVWAMNSSLASSACSPKIMIDGTERIWLFWVGQLRDHDEILYTFFDGQIWSEPLSLNLYSDVPHITPSISLDYNGFPHVVWSAYDGDDYELYDSCWDGIQWTQENKITNNQNTADTFPSISYLLDIIPAVAWSKHINEKRQVYLTYKTDEEWSSAIRISGDESITGPPKIISSRGKIGVLWQVHAEIKIALTDFYRLQEYSFQKKTTADLPRVLPLNSSRILALDKDKYIGFGDSITYGVIAREAAPEKGYVPRLERLLDDNIRESEVVNHGVGGEKTAEGLSRISAVMRAEQAKTIFIMEGTNDAKEENISINTAAFNLRKMSERSLNFGMKPFLASIIPLKSWEGITKERILELNEKIESIAASPNIHFVDQFDPFMDYPGDRESLYSDATHPNEQGYQLIAETWYQALFETMPSIEINKTSLYFEAIEGEANPPPQTFEIRNSGGGVLDYTINADQDWISISPESDESRGEWDEIEVSVDISNLARGSYEGDITVSDNNASNSPQILTIQVTILGPSIGLDKTTLSFEAVQGEENPAPQTFSIRNSGGGVLDYKINADQDWIRVSPESGDSTGEWDAIEVSVDISNLARGSYEGNVTVSSEGAFNSPQLLTIQVTILSPVIELDKTTLSFEGTFGEANPVPQTFRIRNSGAGTLNYQISDDKDWINISPKSGDSKGEWDEIEVSVDISNLSEKDYQGNVIATAENASNSPKNLAVNLTIKLPPLFPPLNFHGERKKNRSLSQLEYINILSWEQNPQNKFIEKYLIYLVEGENKILLKEVNTQTFEYWHRKVEGNKVYRYGLTAEDEFGRESETVTIEIR